MNNLNSIVSTDAHKKLVNLSKLAIKSLIYSLELSVKNKVLLYVYVDYEECHLLSDRTYLSFIRIF